MLQTYWDTMVEGELVNLCVTALAIWEEMNNLVFIGESEELMACIKGYKQQRHPNGIIVYDEDEGLMEAKGILWGFIWERKGIKGLSKSRVTT